MSACSVIPAMAPAIMLVVTEEWGIDSYSSKSSIFWRMQEWIDQMDTFVLDCDGVLWLGNTLLPRVTETLDRLRSLGKRLLFVTNNSTKSRTAYLQKFKSLGLQVHLVIALINPFRTKSLDPRTRLRIIYHKPFAFLILKEYMSLAWMGYVKN